MPIVPPNEYATLAPRTNWIQARSHPMIMGDPGLIVFGTFVQPTTSDPLRAIVTIDLYPADQGHWLHLSISRARRLPTWADLCAARDQLGYKEVMFIQLLPPASAWLNTHSYCLHLQHRIDAETVPEMLWQQEGADGLNYGKEGRLR